MITTEQKSKIVELRAKDYSIARIAKEVGISKTSVIDTIQGLREKIAVQRAVELETLYEEQHLSTKSRIERLSEMLEKVTEELRERDFQDVPTDRLIELSLKLQVAIKEERVEPQLMSSQEIDNEQRDREALESLSS